jgi:hypothetical protein
MIDYWRISKRFVGDENANVVSLLKVLLEQAEATEKRRKFDESFVYLPPLCSALLCWLAGWSVGGGWLDHSSPLGPGWTVPLRGWEHCCSGD